jgi:hypothetical protein
LEEHFVRSQSFLLLIVGVLGIGSVANAGPISSCANNIGDSGFTCNFFETLANGTPSEISNVVSFPVGQIVSSGYVILLGSPGASHADPTQWSDVLNFIDDGGGVASTAQLLSIGCICFPTFAQVTAAPNVFLVETQTGTGNDFTDSTQFVAGFNLFNIFSAAPISASAPEPASLTLTPFALILLFAVAFLRPQRFTK